MSKKLFLYGLLLIPFWSVAAVEDSISVVKGSRIFTDHFENVYVVTPENDIIKYGKNAKKIATANFKVLGNITSIDAGNPFEIFVFYRDQNKVMFLDNMLNVRGECDLEQIDVSQVAFISRSFDNQIWLFDLADLKLKKYSKELKLLLESAPLNTSVPGQTFQPEMMYDLSGQLYMLNKQSILEFDLFANYVKTIHYDSISHFQVLEKRIIYYKSDSLWSYNPMNFTLKNLNISIPTKSKQVLLSKDYIYFLTDEYLILRPYSFLKKD